MDSNTTTSGTPASTAGATVLSQSQFDQLLSAVSTSADQAVPLETKLEKLKEDLRREQELTADKLAKRAKLERP